MTALPEGILGKILALAICGVLLAVAYLVAVEPALNFYQDRAQELSAQQATIARLAASARGLPALRASAAQWRTQSRDGGLLLAGSSDGVAAAAIQSSVKDFLDKSGAKLGSAEILPPMTHDNFQRVGVRVSLTGTLPMLLAVLRGVGTVHPVLFVDNVEIHTASGTAKTGGGDLLSVALDIYGFRAL